MIKRTNEDFKRRMNVEFPDDYQLEKKVVAFETTKIEFDMAVKEAKRQIAAVEAYYEQKTPHADSSDEELVVHLYEKGFEMMFNLMSERTNELEQLISEREHHQSE